MTPDSAALLDAMRHARVLEAAQLDEVARQLRPRLPESRALASELIKRDWLTPYQANQLLQGRGKELLLGSYVLLERLGEGGMGQVFKARNWKLGKVVAIKLIRKERMDNPDAVRRFHREIRAAAQLDHPNIVRAFDADEVGGTHLLVMEYAPGTDLAKLVKKGGPLPVDKACDYCRQAALGLQHACERGLVHRDIKPHNLLLTPNGVVKILDMGLARLDHAREEDEASSTMTREGTVMGTLDFIAPEQAMDSHTVDVRADLYSLGCTLYFLLTGRVPFPGGTAMEKLMRHQSKEPEPVERLRPGLSPAVAGVVRKLMAKRPGDRCQTPGAAAAALTAAGEARATAARVVVAAPEPTATGWSSLDTPPAGTNNTVAPRPRRGAPWLLLGTTAGAALLALGLTLAFLTLPRAPGPAAPTPPPTAPHEDSAEAAFEKWRRQVAALPAAEQGEAVGAELKRRNPDFDGAVQATVENGVVTALEFTTDHVTDISPVRPLPGLRRLMCQGSGPGKGRLSDLSPLRDMKLTMLHVDYTAVADLSPLKDMPLEQLGCGATQTSDLSPLKNMSLQVLFCWGTGVSDLSPLKGMPLTSLTCGFTPVSDLSPLKGMPLVRLWCEKTRITDLSPLRNAPLREIRCDFDPKRDAEFLRSIKTLETINGTTAKEFWKALDDKLPDSKP